MNIFHFIRMLIFLNLMNFIIDNMISLSMLERCDSAWRDKYVIWYMLWSLEVLIIYVCLGSECLVGEGKRNCWAVLSRLYLGLGNAGIYRSCFGYCIYYWPILMWDRSDIHVLVIDLNSSVYSLYILWRVGKYSLRVGKYSLRVSNHSLRVSNNSLRVGYHMFRTG